MKPTLHKTAWRVFTDDQIYQGIHMGAHRLCWAWVAYGPRGSEAGVEANAEDAARKAMCAAEVLAEPERKS